MIDQNQSACLLDVARRAALLVRDPLLAAFRSSMQVDYKVDLHDIVTVHDKQSEATIRDFIFAEVPDSTMLGEEGGSVGTGSVHWYVDPIDGTANFAAGMAFWCVSIAAVVDGQTLAGVVFDPVSGNMFSANLDGVWLNGAPMKSRSVAEEKRATLITGYPVSRDFRLDGRQVALDRFGRLTETFSTLRRPGSAALSIAHVAAGWADAAAGFGVNSWDVTAAILILERAGGTYKPFSLGKVPDDAPGYMCPGYVALGEGGDDYPTLLAVAGEIDAARKEADSHSRLEKLHMHSGRR